MTQIAANLSHLLSYERISSRPPKEVAKIYLVSSLFLVVSCTGVDNKMSKDDAIRSSRKSSCEDFRSKTKQIKSFNARNLKHFFPLVVVVVVGFLRICITTGTRIESR